MPPRIQKQLPSGRRSDGVPTDGAHAVLSRIKPIGFDEGDGIKIMLYGRSGSGKTTIWSTFPKPILSVICSGGKEPGELRSIDTPENRDLIYQVVLEESSELRTLCENCPGMGYQTIVLDHVTGFQDLVLKEVLGMDQLPAQKNWGMASQQQYGTCTMQCKDLLRSLLSLKGNVVVVAQEREFSTDSSSELITPVVGANLVPSLTGWLNSAVDYICQTIIRQKTKQVKRTTGQGKAKKEMVVSVDVKDEVEYCIRAGPHPVYTTKFRVPKGTPLPHLIVDPDYDVILGLIRSAQTHG